MKDAFGLNVYGFIDKHEFMTSFPSVFLNCNEYLERNIIYYLRRIQVI